MRKHLAVAVGVVSLACGGYLWTNNTAAFAANKNDQPAETITISSNPEEVTIECNMAGGEGMFMPTMHGEIAASTHASHMPAMAVHKPLVSGTLHHRSAAGASADPLAITSQISSTHVTKPFAMLGNADAESSDCGIAVPVGIDWFELAAETIGVSSDELLAGIENEVSIADQAAAKGVSKQTVIDAIVAAETANINQLVIDGQLSAEDAALFTADLPEMIEHFVSTASHFIPSEGVACVMVELDESGTSTTEEAVDCEAIEAVPALPVAPTTDSSR
ncbi:MAG TPA: hypothetical protein DEF47_10935 [Herpetosiphon sp.]|uniref:Uncharacterized protein n=1 Tax=Herpetosiphon aurantiacus (strain ATCC 23779 / DSM 785 / 114-95) TaxID=316274 RepID=A9AXX9_HERA2|nr:hypothetical protein [Herpetosiphon sp.]ABX04945.1 hypothetical protein Haur_2305 [Herpetosiphon aurantiacus DSM 785]HBW50411.1 hypothetical protein [Herpetosiphon sp.]